jgi:uncharacterized protein (TIGR02594 family)
MTIIERNTSRVVELMDPRWIEVAKEEAGVHEVVGGENPRILEYFKTTSYHAKADEVPWCSAFVNWCMGQAGIVGSDSAAARSWLHWGRTLTVPEYGCVCVIQAKVDGKDPATGSESGFHVAFWLGEADGMLTLLGGNQSDQVKVSHFPLNKYKVQGYRLP